jgi:hypothetical protein
MNQARRALILADPHAKTVAEIATDHGFWEFGRFAVRYQHLFGEAPSVTLHRPPEIASRSPGALVGARNIIDNNSSLRL